MTDNQEETPADRFAAARLKMSTAMREADLRHARKMVEAAEIDALKAQNKLAEQRRVLSKLEGPKA